MTVGSLVDASFRPLDAARRALMRGVWRLPWLAHLVQRSETRVPVLASISVVVAFAITCVAPGLLFVLGPALLGVLHVASDVRYLVLRQDLPRRWVFTVIAVCGALLAIRLLEIACLQGLQCATIEVGLGWGLGLVGVAMGAAAARDDRAQIRAMLITLPLGAAMIVGLYHPFAARAALAYGHNVVALLLWFVLFRSRKAYALAPLVIVVAASALLLTGDTVPWLRADSPWALTFIDEALAVSRRLPEQTAISLGLSYVFLQAVHYSAWLTWIPREETRGSPLTFTMSLRAARRDFGAAGLAVVLGATALVVVLSIVAVHRTRALYLSLATFHGYLEIASLAFLVTRAQGRRGSERARVWTT